jgi:hypothetical protein
LAQVEGKFSDSLIFGGVTTTLRHLAARAQSGFERDTMSGSTSASSVHNTRGIVTLPVQEARRDEDKVSVES